MEYLGIPVSLRNRPPLDPDFLPLHRFSESFLATARRPFSLAVERPGGVAVCRTRIHGTSDRFAADVYHVERCLKTLLWVKGGYRVHLSGDADVCAALRRIYAPGGARAFDACFMADVYRQPFQVIESDLLPARQDDFRPLGGHLRGYRIGFDAGGSDRKVSALIDGRIVYSQEVVWHPAQSTDPAYHYDGVVSSLRAAAAHLPRVDAVGISSAGILLDNRIMRSSLFRGIPPEAADDVPDLYLRAVTDTFGSVPCAAANDGDVSALAGAMALGERSLLGIAMGTSQAGGFVDAGGRITGWLNELAFVPVDVRPDAAADEWSGDVGCGAQYFSQEAVIRLAAVAGIPLDDHLSPAEKLQQVQTLLEHDDPRPAAVFDTIGVYLAHALAQYHTIYGFHHVLLLGRVTSGHGGEHILARCRAVLADEYPAVARAVHLTLPDESFRRLGQSAAAASLPALPLL
ncbi:MAG: ROK family protein [Ruminococcaceae bacterium]|jgi:predicted NBD/HSP70 family sugar kinase|nr:ROK family protein [Oscillospiraceae bacterium]